MTNQESDKIRKYMAVMGLSEGAGLKELRDAYHRKAAILHPDKNPDDHVRVEAFKKVNVAYEFLKKHMRSVEKNRASSKASSASNPHEQTEITPAGTVERKPREVPTITVDELVFRLKHSQNKYVRIHAIKELEKHGCKEAAWALLPSLGDFEEEVALCAAGALGRMGARIATVPLISLYKKSSPPARRVVETALAAIGSPMAMKFLANLPGAKQRSSQSGENGAASSGYNANRA